MSNLEITVDQPKCDLWLHGGGAGRCALPWGHDGAKHFNRSGYPRECGIDDAAEHARRQQAVVDAAKLERIRTWCLKQTAVANTDAFQCGFDEACKVVLSLIENATCEELQVAGKIPDGQPAAAPVDPMRDRLAKIIDEEFGSIPSMSTMDDLLMRLERELFSLRQERAAAPATVKRVREWANGILTFDACAEELHGFYNSAQVVLRLLNEAQSAAPEAGEPQTPTEPSPSNPMRLAEAFAMVEAFMRRHSITTLGIDGAVTGVWRPGRNPMHSDTLLSACWHSFNSEANEHLAATNASSEKCEAARAVLAELTEA